MPCGTASVFLGNDETRKIIHFKVAGFHLPLASIVLLVRGSLYGICFSFSNVRYLATCTHLWKDWPPFVTVLLSFDRGRCRLTSLFPVSGTVGQVRVVFGRPVEGTEGQGFCLLRSVADNRVWLPLLTTVSSMGEFGDPYCLGPGGSVLLF